MNKKRERSSQRRGRQMAKTNKTINTDRTDDHMGRKRQLRIDSRDQMERHTNEKVRKPKNLPPLTLIDPVFKSESRDDIGPRTLEQRDDLELARDADLILALRVYELNTKSEIIGRSVGEDEFCAIHRELRRERVNYRDLNGQMVTVGEEIRRYDMNESRKQNTRLVPGVLKSIMVRLMPHEGVAFGKIEKDEVALATAIDATVKAFELATGCEAVTAAVHRMSPTDCHIHVQYTMVQAVTETKCMLGRRLKKWEMLAVEMAKKSLAAEEISTPASAAIKAKKRQLIAEGKLTPEPEAGIEFRKFPGLRDLGDGAILGYSFRQKLNLVRAAETGEENELAKKVTDRNDERFGRFAPIARRSDADLEAKYLDLWLERVWRRNVTSMLPDEIQKELISGGVDSARSYADFGTSMVEKEHIKRRTKELVAKAKEIEAAGEIAKQQTIAAERAKKLIEEERNRMATRIAELEVSANAATTLKTRLAETEIKLDESRDEKIRVEAYLEKAIGDVASLELELSDTKREKTLLEEEQKKMGIRMKALETAAKLGELLKAELQGFLKSILKSPKVYNVVSSVPAVWKPLEKLAGLVGINLGPEMK